MIKAPAEHRYSIILRRSLPERRIPNRIERRSTNAWPRRAVSHYAILKRKSRPAAVGPPGGLILEGDIWTAQGMLRLCFLQLIPLRQ
jgi:hypothetical protein